MAYFAHSLFLREEEGYYTLQMICGKVYNGK